MPPEHYNYFRDYDPSLGRYIQSDPIGLRAGINTFGYVEAEPLSMIDPFGLKGAPSFNPGNNSNPAWLWSNNCYSYALNKSGTGGGPFRGAGGTQPGDGAGKRFKQVTCSDIMAAAKADGAVEPGPGGDCGGVCPEGYHKIKLVITERPFYQTDDYHWFRQDSGGGWSSKRGAGAASQHGMSCPGPYFDYTKICGVLCVRH